MAEDIVHTAEETDTALRAVTATIQAAQAYARLIETTELEARIAAIEEADAARAAGNVLSMRGTG